jgi:hypothetical protein
MGLNWKLQFARAIQVYHVILLKSQSPNFVIAIDCAVYFSGNGFRGLNVVRPVVKGLSLVWFSVLTGLIVWSRISFVILQLSLKIFVDVKSMPVLLFGKHLIGLRYRNIFYIISSRFNEGLFLQSIILGSIFCTNYRYYAILLIPLRNRLSIEVYRSVFVKH